MYEDQDIELSDQDPSNDSEKGEMPPLVPQGGDRVEGRRYGWLKILAAVVLAILSYEAVVLVSAAISARSGPPPNLKGGGGVPTRVAPRLQTTQHPESLPKLEKPAIRGERPTTELPREVQNAQALLEYYRRKHGDHIPAEDQPFARVANRVLERYRQSTPTRDRQGPQDARK